MREHFNQRLAHVTGGRRYCFVIMTYHENYAFFERIRAIVSEQAGFECIRADDIPGSGEDLRGKIHAAIDSAALVIADVTHVRPNIYYEVGYAVARDKPMLLLARDAVEIPTDLLGVELIRYADNKDAWPRFEHALKQHLAVHSDSSVSLLRAMVVPKNPYPSYIVINPKKPTITSRFQFHPRELRTYGDHLGVTGILGAFASVYGEHFAPELLSGPHAPDELLEWDANLYLIGAPKSNRFTKIFLEAMQREEAPNWQFRPCLGDEGRDDYEVELSGLLDGVTFKTPRLQSMAQGDRRFDYGLIVRGPHPRHHDRLITILAGPHSLGTGAACLAATKSQVIRKIAQQLAASIDLGSRDRTFWVLVKGVADEDLHIRPDGVEVFACGVYPQKRPIS